ncbi:hypothetical protein BKA57DRAFT_269698 [Linnemannia elongata]|nr:hypothetical protein BKA57DRAFT_269698 [Linnemannia elongata]
MVHGVHEPKKNGTAVPSEEHRGGERTHVVGGSKGERATTKEVQAISVVPTTAFVSLIKMPQESGNIQELMGKLFSIEPEAKNACEGFLLMHERIVPLSPFLLSAPAQRMLHLVFPPVGKFLATFLQFSYISFIPFFFSLHVVSVPDMSKLHYACLTLVFFFSSTRTR